jgi:hypothetical protein
VGRPHTFAQSRQTVVQLKCYTDDILKNVIFRISLGAFLGVIVSLIMAVVVVGDTLWGFVAWLGAYFLLGGLIIGAVIGAVSGNFDRSWRW